MALVSGLSLTKSSLCRKKGEIGPYLMHTSLSSSLKLSLFHFFFLSL